MSALRYWRPVWGDNDSDDVFVLNLPNDWETEASVVAGIDPVLGDSSEVRVLKRAGASGSSIVSVSVEYYVGAVPFLADGFLSETMEGLPDSRREAFWRGFHYLSAYVERNGSADVPRDYEVEGYPLGLWVEGLRTTDPVTLTVEERGWLEALPGWGWADS